MKTFLECIGEAAREPGDEGFMNWLIFKLDEEQLEHLARAAVMYAEQSNSHKPVVVRGGDSETQSVQRVEPDFNGRNVMKILYTPTEPLPAAEVAQNGRDGLCNCVNQFFGYINCGYDCQRNKE